VKGPYTERGLRPALRSLHYFRGYLALKSGREAEAFENFKEVLRHRPLIWDIDSFEDCLANAYLETGRVDEAIAEYERILRLNPNYPLAHYHLARSYERKGLPERARTSYERFLQVWKDADADLPEVVSARERLSGGRPQAQ
jgi:tetratricopeptide (TPR) repeat protein